MQGEFKQCPNGHYYQGASCPYCKTENHAGRETSLKTEIFIGRAGDPTKTEDPYWENSTGRGTNTTVIDGQETVVGGTQRPNAGYSRTEFGDEETQSKWATGSKKEPRYSRKLVGGW